MSLHNGSVRLAHRVTRQNSLPIATLPAFLCPGLLRHASSSSQRYHRARHRKTEATAVELTGANLRSRSLASVLKTAEFSQLPIQCPGCGALSQVERDDDPGLYRVSASRWNDYLENRNKPGFYTLSRKSLRNYFDMSARSGREEDAIWKDLIARNTTQGIMGEGGGNVMEELSSAFAERIEPHTKSLEPPVCDRCHYLKHHDMGASIVHPSVQSIQDTILESPHKRNHVYHIIDAADFPMSLVKGLHRLFHLTPQRSHNRRAQLSKYHQGTKRGVSFIITRSDLLGPTKDHVDHLMPVLLSVLRDALGRAAQDYRLGNVTCVSAKRQWWTKELKEEIWLRGGGGWLVGKVNVGKSQLLHDVFPKGRMGDWGNHMTVVTASGRTSSSESEHTESTAAASLEVPTEVTAAERISNSSDPSKDETLDLEADLQVEKSAQELSESSGDQAIQAEDEVKAELGLSSNEALIGEAKSVEMEEVPSTVKESFYSHIEALDTESLLSPQPTETSYPAMPLVSALPGTTASPIRMPFGNGKGELIDLPGLSRGDLEQHVQHEHRASLVMTTRIVPTQRVLKPSKSLLIGGFIRITPTTPDVTILAYNFTRLQEHLTSTEKAVAVQTRKTEQQIENISIPGTEEKIASAGKFYLKYDVTQARTGPMTRKDAGGVNIEALPFRVLGIDILIEGVGWIELACQVRKPYGWIRRERLGEITIEDDPDFFDPTWPEVEVFTPEGKFVGQRRCLNAWMMVDDRPRNKNTNARPRKAMKGVKHAYKMRTRDVRQPHSL